MKDAVDEFVEMVCDAGLAAIKANPQDHIDALVEAGVLEVVYRNVAVEDGEVVEDTTHYAVVQPEVHP